MMSQLYHEFGVTLSRRSADEPWGIRLAGGSDLNSPLIIIRVNIERVVFRIRKRRDVEVARKNLLLCDNKL